MIKLFQHKIIIMAGISQTTAYLSPRKPMRTAPTAMPAKNMDLETNIKLSRSQYKSNWKRKLWRRMMGNVFVQILLLKVSSGKYIVFVEQFCLAYWRNISFIVLPSANKCGKNIMELSIVMKLITNKILERQARCLKYLSDDGILLTFDEFPIRALPIATTP